MTPKDALKGKKVFVYARVSTEGQEGTIPDQIKTVKAGLKKMGFNGKVTVFSEQQSGTKNPIENPKFRPELAKMLKEVHESKRPAIIVVRDVQRFSRDPYDLGELYNPLRRKNIPIISINENMVLGTKSNPEPQSDLLAPILVSAGGAEVSSRTKQTLQGMMRSREKGIFGGTPLSLYPKDDLEPRAELIRMMRAGVSGSETARRLNKSTSWVRKNRKQIETILVDGGDKLLDDWLETINLIRDLEIEKGAGTGPRATVRMKTVRRMTSGYLNNPNNFDKPTEEEIMNYFNNYNDFKKKS